MSPSVQDLEAAARAAIAEASDENSLNQVKSRFLGKSSDIAQILKGMKGASPEERRTVGRALNMLKKDLEQAVTDRRDALKGEAAQGPALDLSLGGRTRPVGHMHPLRRVRREIEDIFMGLGFDIEEGPHVETEFHNFTALNMPEGHPARDMQDTFYLEGGKVLRTHTSPVQIRTMLRDTPPIRMICPGTVYRSDDVDQTHSPMFNQVEGLMVDTRVTFADLKGILTAFTEAMFGPDLPLRFRASYFPFTEPSAEVDIRCFKCRAKDPSCRVCKATGWIEILGCGMVNPVLYQHIGKPEYQQPEIRGFAFGMGIERIALLKYGVPDMRMFFENDVRFLEHF